MHVVFVTPYFTENAKLFLDRLSAVEGVRLSVVAQEEAHAVPSSLRSRFVDFVQVTDALSTVEVVGAARRLESCVGPIDRLLGIMEQVQVPVAEARATLGLSGMTTEVARNFRDKHRMKDILRNAGVPVARHCLAHRMDEALSFARDSGFPVVVKPPAGAASQTTYRVEDESALRAAVEAASVAAGGAVLLEEFVQGEEHSYDAFVRCGKVEFYSISNYHPTPLEVMQNPWMQWVVVMPRECRADDIASVGQRALSALGLEDGMCHVEWFRRRDGSIVISEAGARPPGAQFPTLISRAHDVDCIGAWAMLATTGELPSFPERKYATGAAYLRGQGEGRVRAVHGLEGVERDLGSMITDRRIPGWNQEKAKSYEGEGFILVRHHDTSVVERALSHIVSNVRVELG